jgi:hypothetical protein
MERVKLIPRVKLNIPLVPSAPTVQVRLNPQSQATTETLVVESPTNHAGVLPSTKVNINIETETDVRILKPDTLVTWWSDTDENGTQYNQRYGRLLRYEKKNKKLTAVIEVPKYKHAVILFIPAERIEPVK